MPNILDATRPTCRSQYPLLSLPGVCIGVLTGRMLNRRLSGERFFRLVFAGLVVTGTVLVAQAINGAW